MPAVILISGLLICPPPSCSWFCYNPLQLVILQYYANTTASYIRKAFSVSISEIATLWYIDLSRNVNVALGKV